MEITINLCSTPYVNLGRTLRRAQMTVIWLACLSVCAGALLVFAHFNRNTHQAEEQRLDAAIARESEELASYRKMLDKPENVSIASRAIALNSLFNEKSFSWTMLMRDFEDLVPAEVQLATIHPVREKDGSISIRMHVVGPRQKVIDLIQGLEVSKTFSRPHVTAETARSDARPNQRATALTAASFEEFDIQAGYEESGPAPTENTSVADRETASAPLAGSDSNTTYPKSEAVPVALVHSKGTR